MLRRRQPITAHLPLLLLALILLASAIPYGGVALWAQTLTGLLCLLYAGSWFLARRERKPSPPAMPGTRVFVLFFAWTVVLAVVRIARDGTGGGLGSAPIFSTTLFLWIAWALLAVTTRRLASGTNTLRYLITGVAILAGIQGVIGIIGLHTPLGAYSRFVSGPRAVGTFSSGNAFGGFLALSLPPTLAMAQLAMIRAGAHIRQRRARMLHEATRADVCVLTALLWLLATLVQAVALLLSGSRGAISAALVALVGICVWFVRDRTGGSQRDRIPVAAILATLLILVIGAGGTYAFTLQRLKTLETTQQAALPRTLIWQSALRQIARQPLGAGPGRFAEAFLPFQPPGYGGNRVYHAHNDYLEVMSETGIPGMLLLLTAFSLALTGATRRLSNHQYGESIWMRRAALLSVVAGLIHAAVDFNLTSRPGVAALFFCLLGVALARRAHAGDHAPAPAVPIRRRLQRSLITIACGLLAANQIRLATAATLMEQGFAAIIGEPSLYFWLPVPALNRDQALARLRQARRLAPESAEIHLRLARALVIDSEHRLTTAIANARDEHPDLPAHVVASRMRILLRRDERDRLTRALGAAETACRLAPRNGDAAAQAARITARLAALMPTPEAVGTQIDSTLSRAARARALAPNDATILRQLLASLARLADALAVIEAPSQATTIRQSAMEIGLHLLHLGQSRLDSILDSWSRLGLDTFAVLEAIGPLPADAARQLYQFHYRQHDSSSARRALDALETALDAGLLSAAGFRDPAREAELLADYRHLLTREHARWHLRQHRFATYREQSDARQAVLRHDIESKLAQGSMNEAVARRFRYLNLRSLHKTRGLDEAHARELAVLMEQHGEAESAIADVLSPFLPAPEVDGLISEKPDHLLDMHLLGGRAVLVGFSIRDDTIYTFWRFHARVPADLQARFYFRDEQRAHAASADFRFSRELGRRFAVGAPPIGRVFRGETALPALAELSIHLELGLYSPSSRQWLPTPEGLPRCEIDNWKSLRRTDATDTVTGDIQKTD